MIKSLEHQLFCLLSAHSEITVDSLANKLGKSNADIWQALSYLMAYGLPIVKKDHQTILVKRPYDALTLEVIEANLNPLGRSFADPLTIHFQLPSTNDHLRNLAKQNAPTPSICLTEHQTAGKGRHGKTWLTPIASQIALSLVWQSKKPLHALSGLSLAVGVAVARALKAFTEGKLQLKWPNDLFIQDEKLAGILIEMLPEGEGAPKLIIGIGINCFDSPKTHEHITQPHTSLSKYTTHKIDRNMVVAELINHLAAALNEFDKTGFSGFLTDWQQLDMMTGHEVLLKSGVKQIKGRYKGINQEGAVLIEQEGITEAFISGHLRKVC